MSTRRNNKQRGEGGKRRGRTSLSRPTPSPSDDSTLKVKEPSGVEDRMFLVLDPDLGRLLAPGLADPDPGSTRTGTLPSCSRRHSSMLVLTLRSSRGAFCAGKRRTAREGAREGVGREMTQLQ